MDANRYPVTEATFAKHLQLLMAVSTMIAGVGVVMRIAIVQDGLSVGVGGVILVLMFNFGFFRNYSPLCGVVTRV
jgi:hypothetical protein